MADLSVDEQQFDPISLAYKGFAGRLIGLSEEPLRQTYSFWPIYGGSYMANIILADAGPRAVNMFIKRAREDFHNQVVLLAVGMVKNALTVYVVLREIDVSLTRRLFELKTMLEDEQRASFELHVKFGEGRNARELIPADFRQI